MGDVGAAAQLLHATRLIDHRLTMAGDRRYFSHAGAQVTPGNITSSNLDAVHFYFHGKED